MVIYDEVQVGFFKFRLTAATCFDFKIKAFSTEAHSPTPQLLHKVCGR